MAVPIEQVNDAISFEQSTFSKIRRVKNLGSIVPIPLVPTLGQQVSTLEQLEREQIHTHTDRQTNYCNPAAHAQRVNKNRNICVYVRIAFLWTEFI